MNLFLLVVLVLLIADYLLRNGVDLVNLRHVQTEIPDEFQGWYDEEKYSKSQQYLKDSTRFDVFSSSIQLPIMIAFILLGGFRWVDELARSVGGGVVVTGLIFGGILLLFSQLLHLPFGIYSTFKLEGSYGFNKTTPATYVTDLLKELVLTAVIGGPLFAAVIWFFAKSPNAWLICWVVLTGVQFGVIYLAPAIILPLFNKFEPLEDGELKESISSYSTNQGFQLKGIFTMDGSKRSTRSNAYFTGFGRWRRIVLFDTLVEKHSVDELVSIFAHEVGHFKLRHIQKMLVMAILSTGLMFFILSLFITQPGLYEAFKLDFAPIDGANPIYAGLLLFGFLYTPISLLLGLGQSIMSRKHEFEADAFAVQTAHQPDAMVDALKKLTVDNLSNLTPHPLKVFLEYSHPPVLQRIAAIRRIPQS